MDFSAEEIIDRIKEHCSLTELESIGIPQSTFSKWKARNTIPRSDDLYRIAKYIGVSMEYLLTGEDKNSELPEDLLELFNSFQRLSPKDREPLLHIIGQQIDYWVGYTEKKSK